MIKYIKTKLFFYGIKKTVYEIFTEQSDVVTFAKNLIESCKDMTGEELRNQFIRELAGFAHEQAVKEREKESAKNENAFVEK